MNFRFADKESRYQIFMIQNGGRKNEKSTIILVKMCTQEFSGSLNPLSNFDDSRRRIQDHGWKKMKKAR